MSEFINRTTLPFIPDGNPPTENTNSAGNNTTVATTQATTVSSPVQPEPEVIVTFPDAPVVSDTTVATTESTTATTEAIAVATDEAGTAVTSVNPEGETVVIATNSAGESIAATTNSAGEVAATTTTVLVQPDGTVSTGFESEGTYIAETIEVVPGESTEEAVTQNKSNTNFVLAFIAVILVFLIAGALILIPKLKKSK